MPRSRPRPARGQGAEGRLRIVAGAARGRRLRVVPGTAVRPTPDRVREALFSILGRRCEGARVLDACAGTGALGLEALSRGAASVLLVERDGTIAEVLRENVARVGLAGAEVVVGDVARLATRLATEGRASFDLAFVDPPFGDDRAATIARAIAESGALAPGALLVVEHPADNAPSLPELDLVDQRRYGTVGLAIFESERTRD